MPYSFGRKRYKNVYSMRKRGTRYGRKRYGGGRYGSGFKWSNAMYYAKAAWRGVKYIKGLVNSEMYHLDTNLAGAEILSDGAYAGHLTALAQGDGDGARTGSTVYVKGLHINGSIVQDSDGATAQSVRIMVVQDTQQVADTVPTPSVWLSGTGGFLAHLNPVNLGRFTVLYDKIINVYAASAGAPNLKTFEISLPLATHVHYNGTAGTDIQKNGLYIGAISSQATAGTGPILAYNARLSYHDN